MRAGKDLANMLASRDKSSIVKSFQENVAISRQRESKMRVQSTPESPRSKPGPVVSQLPDDADKLVKDAGGMMNFFESMRFACTNMLMTHNFLTSDPDLFELRLLEARILWLQKVITALGAHLIVFPSSLISGQLRLSIF